MYTLQLVPSDLARSVSQWDVVDKWLRRAIAHSKGRQSLPDVVDDCEKGEKQLWVVREGEAQVVGTLVTEIRKHPEMQVCSVILLGGVGFDQWKYLAETLEIWARDIGCTKMDLQGRPGWIRKFNGWKLIGVFLEKDLVHG